MKDAFLPRGLELLLPGTRDTINLKASVVQNQGRSPKLSAIFYLTGHFPPFLLCPPSCRTHIYLFKVNSLFIWYFLLQIFFVTSEFALHWLLSRLSERKESTAVKL